MSLLKHRLLLVLLCASLLFNIGFAAAALVAGKTPLETVEPQPAAQAEPKRGALYENLALTPEQEEAFGQRRAQVAKEVAARRTEVRLAREKLWRMVAGDAPEPSGLDQQIALISGVQRQVQTMVVQHMLWMRLQLSEPQQELFDGFVKNRMCSCPGCDGGCLGGCSGECGKADSACGKQHSGSECGCGH